MLKEQQEKHLKALCAAVTDALHRVRNKDNSCRCCSAAGGTQHAIHCAMWPLITARGNYRMAEEAELPTEPAA